MSVAWKRPAITAILLLAFGALLLWASGPGFRSPTLLNQHYRKHGAEFGDIGKQEYLRLAQELRDAPAGGPTLQARRPGGEFPMDGSFRKGLLRCPSDQPLLRAICR